jgi:hypothetical protein
MLIISGQKLCGRVDHVPGKCYVKTRFFHFYYVPLIPLSSWVIEQGTEKPTGFRGQQIPMSLKSVLIGWLHAGLVIFGALNCLAGARLILDHRQPPNNVVGNSFKLLLGILCLTAWMLVNFWPYRASESRGRELTERLGLPYEPRESHDDSFYQDESPA